MTDDHRLPLTIQPDVKSALSDGKPVVALESTIITHGMPWPDNLATAERVEEAIRAEGARPATIAVFGGRIHIGLARDELPEYLTHRLRLASCELPLFEPPAIEAIFQATQALPRKVNRLAHYALTSAALDKAKSVSEQHLQTALEEIQP